MLAIENISLKYGKHTILSSLSHTFDEGKTTLIIGESGVGKTSLINILAGLLKPTGGRITNTAERMSYIFQEPRLFEWMSTLENVSTVSTDTVAKEMLLLMGLEGDLDKYPSELSGGMKQRVSIARALAYDPDVIFMDEPFHGLDAERRRDVSQKVFEILRGKTVILVSHDESDTEYADIILKLTENNLDRII